MMSRISLGALALATSLSFAPFAYSADSYAVLTNPQKPNKISVGICSVRLDDTTVHVSLNATHLRRGHMYTVWGNFGDGSFHLDGNIAGGKSHQFFGVADFLPEDDHIALTLVSHGKRLNTVEAIIEQITNGPGSDPGCNGPNAPRTCTTVGTCTVDIPMN